MQQDLSDKIVNRLKQKKTQLQKQLTGQNWRDNQTQSAQNNRSHNYQHHGEKPNRADLRDNRDTTRTVQQNYSRRNVQSQQQTTTINSISSGRRQMQRNPNQNNQKNDNQDHKNTQKNLPQEKKIYVAKKQQDVKPKKRYIAKETLSQKSHKDYLSSSQFNDNGSMSMKDDDWEISSIGSSNQRDCSMRDQLKYEMEDFNKKQEQKRDYSREIKEESKRISKKTQQEPERQINRRDGRRGMEEDRQPLRTEKQGNRRRGKPYQDMDESHEVKSEQQRNYDRRQERREQKQQNQKSENNRNQNHQNNRNNNQRDNHRNNHRDINNERRQPRQYVYRNQCQKYLKNHEKLQENEEQLCMEIKNLKKYVLTSELVKTYDEKPKEISVLKCLDCPVIFFEYVYKNEKRYMQLKDLKKGFGPKIYEFYSIIKKIYDMHYYAVDIEYEEAILQFAKIKGKERDIYLTLNKKDNWRSNGEKKTSWMFYYCLDKYDNVEITFFDFQVKQLNFGQKFIKMKKSQVDQKYVDAYEKFLRSAKANDQQDIINIGEQQVESDHEITNSRTNLHINLYIELRKIQARIEQLINFDTTELEDQMEEKNERQLQLIRAQSQDTEKIQQLGEEVEKLSREIDNFNNVKYDVEKELRQVRFKREKTAQHLDSMNLALKRLIFAKKQLESDLPILGKKQEIFDLLEKNNLIIMEGQTGSGKSTQLPQILCEYYKLFENPNVLPVLVTQPRKIATRSLAERVAEELQEKGGCFVDYVASSGKTHHPKAKIVFKLDRLVLDELVESPTLDAYSCLVIDEAHERTISIDVILGLVKDLLSKRQNFKVIITSASMEISLFEKYFNKKTLKVSGRMYPVNIKYLPSNEEQIVKKIQKAIDQQLLTERNMLKDKYKGHILVFCADTSEIQKLAEIFKGKLNHNVFMVIPLHGKLSSEEQKKAFAKTKQHKLIFASRIAETAITIDGVKVVIDPGWDREMQYDQKTKFSSMKLTQISQSSAKQRAGRAGRTQQGYCLRLYSQYQYKNRKFNKLPEIKNIALEALILRLKTLGIENVSSFDYIERPDDQGMKTSTEVLKMIGCLDGQGKITTIGTFLVKIPIEPFLARAIIEGLLMEKALSMKEYDKLDRKCSILTGPVIQILCMILNAGNLFRITQNFKQLGDYAKYKHFSHEKGDFFFLKNIFDQFKTILTHDRRELNEWLQKSYLIKKTLLQVKDLVKEINSIIKQFNIDEKQMKIDIIKCKTKLEKYTNQEDRILSCLTTCFAANLCLYSGHPQIGYTYMNLEKLVTIYGTSCLSLLGICPKWILAYDFYENKEGKLFCKVANEIDYEFLKNTVEDYVIDKYKIESLRTLNPFYKQIKFELESLILLQLKECYDMREYRRQKEVEFLKKLNLAFSEAQNTISVFIKCDQKLQNEKQQAQKQLQDYIDLLRKKASSKYTHNYIGNIYVSIGNGFEIESIQFKTTQKVYEITTFDEDILSDIKQNFSGNYFIEAYGNNRIKIYIDDEAQLHYLDNYLQFLIDKQERKFTLRKEFSDKRKKVPQTKIYLHWYAGISQKDNILIQFYSNNSRDKKEKLTNQEIIDLTQRQEEYIKKALVNLKSNDNFQFNGRRVRPVRRFMRGNMEQLYNQAGSIHGLKATKNRNGINVYTSMDEIDLLKFFNQLILTNNISYDFQLPKFIKKFRDPERPQCEWKDSKWIEKIQKLLMNVTDKKQSCIRVWGYGVRGKEGQKMTELEKSYRIDMKAEIKTFDIHLLQAMKQKFDGETKILGCQKLHVTSMFSQPIVGISQKAFANLKDEFQYNVENFLKEFPGLSIDYYVKQVRKNNKKSKVYVQISSQNREHILKPVRVLNNLFTPKFLSLSDIEFRFLNNNEGDRMLEDIEIKFDYKIYFGFDKYQRKIKLYCHQSIENKVETVLRDNLSKIRYHCEAISYKGKNLKKIEKIVKDKLKQVDDYNFNLKNNDKNKKFLAYEIVFTYRKIKITADIQTFNQVKNQIMNVKIEEKAKDCQICFQEMLSPYKLFNCKHVFCWACLSNSIKEFKVGQKMQLRCTYVHQNQKGEDVTCNSMINIYDIAKILSEQELYQIFDIHISKFVDKHPEKYKRCPSADCEKIFDVDQINEEKSIDCELCGKHLCLVCQVSHKNYTCKQWKQMLNLSNEYLEKLGIKKCPKCGNGMEKNGGCNHMKCLCGAHVCWICSKLFLKEKQCYDHLAKDHKKIFPDPQFI